MSEDQRFRAVVITGPVGVGKSTTMWALHELLTEREIPNAAIDVDYLRMAWPSPSDDGFNERLGWKNIEVVARNYRQHGSRWLVLADVLEGDQHVAAYRTILSDWELHIVRLTKKRAALVERLKARETDESLSWYLARSEELQGIMERNGIGDVVIEVGDETPREVAELILQRL